MEYIDGDHGAACWTRIAAPSGVERFGRLLREFHDAVAGFEPPPGTTWKLPPLTAQDALVCHGDFTPWNVVWRGNDPVGIIDWEVARPRSRLELFLGGYGSADAVEIVDRASDELTQTYHDVVALASRGLEPQQTWVADGTPQLDLERAAWIEQNRRTILG